MEGNQSPTREGGVKPLRNMETTLTAGFPFRFRLVLFTERFPRCRDLFPKAAYASSRNIWVDWKPLARIATLSFSRAVLWICETRLSLTPSTPPICFMVRS